jgi:hypothetical protein
MHQREQASQAPVSLPIPRQSAESVARQRGGLPSELPKVNYLEMIFEGQRHLMTKYHAMERENGSPVITRSEEGNLDDRRVQARIHELFGYLVRELSEAMQELKLKPWKLKEELTVEENFVEEMADSFHFFVEICITAGMTADLHRAYFRMHQKNNQRIDGGVY